MQIAGNACTSCGRIVFADEGKFCGKCGIALHITWQRKDSCTVCGGPLEQYERPKANPGSENAFSSNSKVDWLAAPAFAVLVIVLALMAALFAWTWEAVRPQGW